MLPGIPVWFMAFGVDLMTPVPYPIAHALIGGLSADSVVKHPEALKVFPEVRLVDFETATKDALKKTHPSHIERVWDVGRNLGSLPGKNPGRDVSKTSEVWGTVKHEGCFIDHCMIKVNSSPQDLFQAIVKTVDKNGWQVEAEEDFRALVRDSGQGFGKLWMDWRISHATSVTYVAQTVFFSPHGLPGFLYWIFLYPFHRMRFRGLIRRITGSS